MLWGCPIHPNRLVRRCNLPGTPVFHPTRLLRKMQSVGDPGRALALLSTVSGRILRIMLGQH